MKKILLLFLSLSVCNSYASTEENAVGNFSRFIFSSDLSDGVTEHTPLISPFCDHHTVVEIVQSFNPPKEYKESYLSQLDKKGWEIWIKKYGKYPGAIRVVAKYAKKNINSWNSFRKQIVDDPKAIFKWFHSDIMKNRENFYFSVEKEIKQQDLYKSLADGLNRVLTTSQNSVRAEDVSSLSTRNKALEQRILEQTKLNEELTKQISEQSKLIDSLSSKFNSLEQSFRDELSSKLDKISKAEADKRTELEESLRTEIEQRKALEQEITELREQMNKAPVQSESDLTEFSSQIGELKAQFEKLRTSIGNGDPELAGQIQRLSEKVDAMDLEGIRAAVDTILTYIGMDKAPKSKNPLAVRVATFSAIVLALYDESVEKPGFKEAVTKYRQKLGLE
ncbi:MAG: hypothetical protein Q4E61_00840 [Alphaproteobacteria bacterium]|nr:hypothetical protein [Alphaproteobacteria bacterium]